MSFTSQFEDALVFATRLHQNQTRKGNKTPYIGHLLSVAGLVIEDGGSEAETIAALLHDAIEDQGGEATRQEILHRFGEEVTRIVDYCTESTETPKPPWKERKLRYIEQIKQGDVAVCRVSLADKLHNARSLFQQYQQQGDTVWTFFRGGKADTLWFYHQLLPLYQQRLESPMCQDLADILDQLA
ncbi:HD domain-containing protein [Spirulina sp. CS-785/01]|uniref:HD domain-containing protein n=1 Tax=Spirulina sp. CS-785/01 TaxID=3021716 RepID=UPI0023306E27|nr:HD domain-containing protein [Spirulina sp. CS-785/01]MDB9314613.1 HD domain-containing protein [Spirulina sp. CS-785/01]